MQSALLINNSLYATLAMSSCVCFVFLNSQRTKTALPFFDSPLLRRCFPELAHSYSESPGYILLVVPVKICSITPETV